MTKRFEGDYPFGVMTSAYPYLSGDEVLKKVATIGGGGLVQEVELCALDPNGARMNDPNDHVAAHVDTVAFKKNPQDEAKRFADVVNNLELGVTFGNYDFIHTHNPSEDIGVLDFTMELIDYAAALGGRDGGAYGVNVGMFFGMDRTVGIPQNLDAVTRKLLVLGNYAKERNVTIGSENCHMPGGRSPHNDMYLPQAANRSLGSTLVARTILQNRLTNAGLGEVLRFTWDASHPETEGADPLVEAQMTFSKENNNQYHVKGHKHDVLGEAMRKAWFGGPALPGWFADESSPLYKEAKDLGIPIGEHAWFQQYGMVTLAGDGHSVTPYSKIIGVMRNHGFNGRITAENETPRKNDLVSRKDTSGISQMYVDCHTALKSDIWKGDLYSGKPFKPLDVSEGKFLPRMNFTEASKHYNIF